MTPEIKAAIENNSHEYCQNTRFVNLSTDCPTIEQLVIDANRAGAEYGYKLGLLVGKMEVYSVNDWTSKLYNAQVELQKLLGE